MWKISKTAPLLFRLRAAAVRKYSHLYKPYNDVQICHRKVGWDSMETQAAGQLRDVLLRCRKQWCSFCHKFSASPLLKQKYLIFIQLLLHQTKIHFHFDIWAFAVLFLSVHDVYCSGRGLPGLHRLSDRWEGLTKTLPPQFLFYYKMFAWNRSNNNNSENRLQPVWRTLNLPLNFCRLSSFPL